MKRIMALMLAALISAGVMLTGCSGKEMTPEEKAASEEAVLTQQLAEEEAQTGLKRLISRNLTEYEQPVYDFVKGLQDNDADMICRALGVPNTFGENLENWIIVNDYESLRDLELKNICLNSAKKGSQAAINVYLKTPGEVNSSSNADLRMTVVFDDETWSLNPPSGVLENYSFSSPTNKVKFEDTDLSPYATKKASSATYTITFPRALDLENDAVYTINMDMGEYSGHVYTITADGNVRRMLLADLDADTQKTFQTKLESILTEIYRLMSLGAGESDFMNVMLNSSEIAKCVPVQVNSESDTASIAANEAKKALGASVTSVNVIPDDTLEGYPDAYTYRLNGSDGIIMNTKLKITTTSGDVRMKAVFTLRLINGAWKIVSVDSSRDVFTKLSVMDPEW